KRPEVVSDGPGDPRVAAVGGSYGGGLALMLAGYDQRVDAIVPQITWHDLAGAFLPEASGRPPADGVFKRAWAGLFFGTASGAVPSRAGTSGLGGSPGADQPAVGGAPIQTTGPSRAPTSAPTGPPPDGSAPGGGPAAGATPNPNPASPTPPA